MPALAVNLGTSVVSGATRVIGDVAGFVAGDLEAMARDLSLSDEEKNAIGRYRQGTATDADVALIYARKTPDGTAPIGVADQADKARARSAGIDNALDTSSLVNTTRRDALADDLGANFGSAWDQTKTGAAALWSGDVAGSKDLATGMARLVFNAGEAALTNPGAAAEYIAENIPQLAIGAFGAVG